MTLCNWVLVLCVAVTWGAKVLPDRAPILARTPDEVASLVAEVPELHTAENNPFEHAYYLPLVLAAVVLALFVGGKVGPYIPQGTPLALCLCSVYIGFSVSIDVIIKTLSEQDTENKVDEKEHTLTTGYTFNPVCMVVLVEASKLLISCTLYMVAIATRSAAEKQEQEEAQSMDMRAEIAWFSLPAVIFTLNNILVFKALGDNDTSVFGVFRDTMILWTAAMWKGVFGVELGIYRSAAIAIIFVGLVVNQLSHHLSGDFSLAVFWVVVMTLCNASGSVSNEYVLKKNKDLDINLQNAILYALCITASCGLLLATDPSRFSSVHAFFGGFTWLSWSLAGIQACAGLLVSRLLKFTDSVMKTAATCLRGPTLVFVAPFFVKSNLNHGSIVSTLLVAGGCFLYLSQGPLVRTK
eukprot:TRINITY_DN6135_c0_g1_i4.p1 TRINITY_DN6135_c0_g1~~TRINITY_DN6135_c0_g1_i4.p1  ORF type:complete len:410 (+),score=85.08 TRINITY_DN6135_c0_g1_i4:76-1305(+)